MGDSLFLLLTRSSNFFFSTMSVCGMTIRTLRRAEVNWRTADSVVLLFCTSSTANETKHKWTLMIYGREFCAFVYVIICLWDDHWANLAIVELIMPKCFINYWNWNYLTILCPVTYSLGQHTRKMVTLLIKSLQTVQRAQYKTRQAQRRAAAETATRKLIILNTLSIFFYRHHNR